MKYTHEIVGAYGGTLLPECAPGACSGSKTPRVYRAYSLQATVNELKIIIFVLNYLTVLVHTKTIIRLNVGG